MSHYAEYGVIIVGYGNFFSATNWRSWYAALEQLIEEATEKLSQNNDDFYTQSLQNALKRLNDYYDRFDKSINYWDDDDLWSNEWGPLVSELFEPMESWGDKLIKDAFFATLVFERFLAIAFNGKLPPLYRLMYFGEGQFGSNDVPSDEEVCFVFSPDDIFDQQLTEAGQLLSELSVDPLEATIWSELSD